MPVKLKTDYRLGGVPRLYLANTEDRLMKVPEEARKCVGFVQYQTGRGQAMAGTMFFVGVEEEGETFAYAVTAKHVIDGIRKKSVDHDTHVRLNLCDGGVAIVQVPVAHWLYHPTDPVADLAVAPWPMNESFETLFLSRHTFATPKVIERNGIGIGDEVFTVGLFYRHYGRERNIPIVRAGNIAAMPEELVVIDDSQQMEAYLIEMRSIGGLSGSPVFVVKESPLGASTSLYLLGLMHGHWNLKAEMLDEMTLGTPGDEPLNTGIGVVVPVSKILETIDQERLVQQRQREAREAKASRAPTPDTPPG